MVVVIAAQIVRREVQVKLHCVCGHLGGHILHLVSDVLEAAYRELVDDALGGRDVGQRDVMPGKNGSVKFLNMMNGLVTFHTANVAFLCASLATRSATCWRTITSSK